VTMYTGMCAIMLLMWVQMKMMLDHREKDRLPPNEERC
jgi:hypothetical protein